MLRCCSYPAKCDFPKRRLLTVPRVSIASTVSLAFTNKGAGFRICIPAHPLLMVNSAVRVEPYHCVSWAVRLRRRFGREELQ